MAFDETTKPSSAEAERLVVIKTGSKFGSSMAESNEAVSGTRTETTRTTTTMSTTRKITLKSLPSASIKIPKPKIVSIASSQEENKEDISEEKMERKYKKPSKEKKKYKTGALLSALSFSSEKESDVSDVPLALEHVCETLQRKVIKSKTGKTTMKSEDGESRKILKGALEDAIERVIDRRIHERKMAISSNTARTAWPFTKPTTVSPNMYDFRDNVMNNLNLREPSPVTFEKPNFGASNANSGSPPAEIAVMNNNKFENNKRVSSGSGGGYVHSYSTPRPHIVLQLDEGKLIIRQRKDTNTQILRRCMGNDAECGSYDEMSAFRFTHGIVCRLPNAWKGVVNIDGMTEFEAAKREFEEYVKILRGVGLDVIEMPPDEQYPWCPLVEDCAVVCNGIALICRPGNPARRGEVETVRAILKKELELPVMDITDPDSFLDGGDVLFTGREFFVGLSSGTNEKGAIALAAAFPEFPVTTIKMDKETSRLKDFVTMAGPDLICVSMSYASQTLLKRMEREATYRYEKLTVPDESAANVLFVNGTLLHPNFEQWPRSSEVFDEKIVFGKSPVSLRHIAQRKVIAIFREGESKWLSHDRAMALVYLFVFIVLFLFYKVMHLNQAPEKPKIYGRDSRFIDYFVKSCPILCESYIPTAIWGRSGHMQTIVHSKIGRVHAPRSEGERFFVTLRDGALMSYDVYTPYTGHHSEEDLTLAICPGIGNSSDTVYIRAFIHYALRQGYRCAVLNHIGTISSVLLQTPRIFSYGGTTELETMVRELLVQFSSTKIICFGFSMGGNIVTRFLASSCFDAEKSKDKIKNAAGDAGDEPWKRVVGGISVCQAYDAVAVGETFLQWENLRRIYVFIMTLGMKKLIWRHKSILLSSEVKERFAIDEAAISASTSLKDFDEAYTRKVLGYSNVTEMYRDLSSYYVLKKVKRPIVFLNSADDPIVPETLLEKIREHVESTDNCMYVETLNGGHLAFFEGGLLIPRKHGWLDRVALQLCDAMACYSEPGLKPALREDLVPNRILRSPLVGDGEGVAENSRVERPPALSLKHLSSLAC
ncbi:unnamed protein product [Notodromas monacha]|uniref:AB hydrolase-1 domain-containing protein n=1 Tax=Notodromas monacha TaxID=399045 RepID=A0A7R9BR77_9CRUS|nr:unnamed protein product [Notodromas monacha]CAG0919286.1 unnamed protein product [Notodromas monacha]